MVLWRRAPEIELLVTAYSYYSLLHFVSFINKHKKRLETVLLRKHTRFTLIIVMDEACGEPFCKPKSFSKMNFHLQVQVTGGNQPVEPIIQLLLNLISVAQLLTLACAIFGEKVFLGRDPPLLYFKLKQYAFMWMAAVFWIVPSILNKWIITGAFEVFVDGTLIFSKLEQGRMPTAADLTGPLIEMGLQQKGAE